MTYLIDYETIALVFIPLILVIYDSAILSAKKKNKLCKEYIVEKAKNSAFVIYIIFIIAVTLFPILIPPEDPDSGFKVINLSFADLVKMWEYNKRIAIVNIGGNIALFIPFVILGRLNNYRAFHSFKRCIVLSVILILLIEGAQYLEMTLGLAASPRTADIIDVVCNTIGVVVGWMLYSLLLKNKIQQKGNLIL